MFADGINVFREICSENDLECLQRDLACLEKWSDTWLLKFHPEKCKILTVGKLENIKEPTHTDLCIRISLGY